MGKLSKRAAVTVAITGAATLTAGAAYAYWTSQASGEGVAAAGSAANVTLTAGTASASLFPGGSAPVTFTVSNPNSYAVSLTAVALKSGTSPLSGDSACDAGSPVSFLAPTSAIRVPAKATAEQVSLPAAAQMAIAANNACQNKTFTFTLTATATATS